MTNLGSQQTLLNPAVFFLKEKGHIWGIIACHIDDFLHVGEDTFDSVVMEKMRERFLAGKLEAGEFRYIGFELQERINGIQLDQTDYVMGIKNGLIDPTRTSHKEDSLTPEEQMLLRKLVGRLNWAVQGSRPDLAFKMIELRTIKVIRIGQYNLCCTG